MTEQEAPKRPEIMIPISVSEALAEIAAKEGIEPHELMGKIIAQWVLRRQQTQKRLNALYYLYGLIDRKEMGGIKYNIRRTLEEMISEYEMQALAEKHQNEKQEETHD